MAVTYFPFNSIVVGGVPDRPANAETLAAYLAGFFGNGVLLQDDTALQVSASSGMAVQIAAGVGNINGKTIHNDAAEIITLEAASATLDRIDRIIFRLNEADRLMEFAVLKGTPASSPTAPALTRNANVYELCLAEIRIPAGATEIISSYITDTRKDAGLCGTSNIVPHMQDMKHGGTGADNAAEARENLGAAENKNFIKSGSSAKAGLVPAPSTTAGTTKYLREDGSWQTPPNTTYSVATQSTAGLMSAGDKKKLDTGKSAITIYCKTGMALYQTANPTIDEATTLTNVGDGFENLNINGIVNPTRAMKVEISGCITVSGDIQAGDTLAVILRKNDTNAATVATARASTGVLQIPIAPIIFTVAAADNISLWAYNSTAVRGETMTGVRTYLTLKEI